MKANYEEKTKANGSLNLNLYDLNKDIVSQLPDLTNEQLEEKYDIIDKFGCEPKTKEYCMLLGREINYYTIFHNLIKDADETFANAVLDCCKNIGHIKSIEYTEDETAIEIWIVTQETQVTTVLYLFDYSMGVVECRM